MNDQTNQIVFGRRNLSKELAALWQFQSRVIGEKMGLSIVWRDLPIDILDGRRALACSRGFPRLIWKASDSCWSLASIGFCPKPSIFRGRFNGFAKSEPGRFPRDIHGLRRLLASSTAPRSHLRQQESQARYEPAGRVK
jgi:hypothetical protein